MTLPVVVVGAGPVGLAAAAHLRERGLTPLVLEAGFAVGASVLDWGHVRLFSPWRYAVDAAARRLLAEAGWAEPDPDGLPTGRELVEQYLRPLAALPAMVAHIRLGHRVVAVARAGLDRPAIDGVRDEGRDEVGFVVRVRTPDGAEHDVRASAVIDAAGTYATANPLGATGVPALGEHAASAYVSQALPDVLGRDRDRFAGRRVLVVGAGHSAATTLLALARLAAEDPATDITWAVRGTVPLRTYGGGAHDQLPARGRLGQQVEQLVTAGAVRLVTGFRISRLELTGGTAAHGPVRVVATTSDGSDRALTADVVVRATGFRPDLAPTRELRLDLDPALEAPRALAPLIDPNHHSCGTVPPHGHRELAAPERGYYVVGMKSYGRAPTFLMATGYEQVRSVVAALAGDLAAADAVELALPQTGVCSSGGSDAPPAAAPLVLTAAVPAGRGG